MKVAENTLGHTPLQNMSLMLPLMTISIRLKNWYNFLLNILLLPHREHSYSDVSKLFCDNAYYFCLDFLPPEFLTHFFFYYIRIWKVLQDTIFLISQLEQKALAGEFIQLINSFKSCDEF